jgi:hypothetical protein
VQGNPGKLAHDRKGTICLHIFCAVYCRSDIFAGLTRSCRQIKLQCLLPISIDKSIATNERKT